MTRIVVFSGPLSHGAAKTIVELDRRLGTAEWLIVRGGADTVRKGAADAHLPGAEYRLDRLLVQPNVKSIDATAPSVDIDTRVRQFGPDLGLSLSAPDFGRGLIESPRLGTIRLHKGRLPEYYGEAPVFWALWNDEPELVCTVENLSTEPGRGGVIAESAVPRPKYATLNGMELLLDEAGIALLCGAIERILSGKAQVRAASAAGPLHRRPTDAQMVALEQRLAADLPDQGPSYRRVAKAAYLLARLHIGRLTAALGGPSIVTVLTYHRVNDDLRDNVTVGIEQFDHQMAMLRQHCEIVSIEDIVSGNLPRPSRRRLACVTFDDGYKDNFTNALPILLKHQIPASFFVSTGFIGTDRRFPHDVQKGLTDLPNMRWDDLRRMRRHGYVIGSHTVNHIDCAAAADEDLRRELRDSLAALRSEIDIEKAIFAYPFGRRENFSAQALLRVKEAGYAGCLSAYGGINRGTPDPYDVCRGGVNWPFTRLAFLCRIHGLAGC